jgi:hypothetical protein
MPPTISSQFLIDFCDILADPCFEEERNKISNIIRKAVSNPGLTHQLPKIRSNAITDKEYTPIPEYRRIFKENHAVLFAEFAAREISVSTINDWWQKTQKLLPGDLEAITTPKYSTIRWRQQLGNSLAKNDVFMSIGKRGRYIVRPLPSFTCSTDA